MEARSEAAKATINNKTLLRSRYRTSASGGAALFPVCLCFCVTFFFVVVVVVFNGTLSGKQRMRRAVHNVSSSASKLAVKDFPLLVSLSPVAARLGPPKPS